MPVDAFKPQDGITGTNSSDVDVGEINLADMNPEDIRVILSFTFIYSSSIHTGCGRKNSPIWEANKNQTKQDKISFLQLNSMHNAVFKFRNYVTQVAAFIVDILIEPLPVFFYDPKGHFGRNDRNFLGYRLLKTFQILGTTLVYLDFGVAPEKKIARCQIWRTGSHHARRQHAQ
jgi:hypothetical protein